MAMPQTEDDIKRAVDAFTRETARMSYTDMFQRLLKDSEPPTLRAWPVRLWCALRGHGGITNYPGTVYYFREGLCKRCGARVSI